MSKRECRRHVGREDRSLCMRGSNRPKWAGRGLISEFRTAREFQNVIQSGEYSGLDTSGMTAEGCKGEEDSRCYGKSGIEHGESRINGEVKKHDIRERNAGQHR
jgi:hypothetical protein